jgi:hypothetical protein
MIRFLDRWIGHSNEGGADHMTQTEPVAGGDADSAGGTSWTGRTVRGRDGSKLGRLVEVLPGDGASPGGWGVVKSTFGGRRMVPLDGAAADGDRGLTVAADRASVRTAPTLAAGTAEPAATGALQQHYTGRGVLADARALQHERYGGSKLGSAFFGWLVAVGLTVLLGVLAGAVAAAIGADPATGTVVTVAVLIVAYYAGGYVAGRLARFDGGRQGFGVWMIAVLVGALAGGAGWVLDSQYGLADEINRPDVALADNTLLLGSIAAAAALLVLTLLAAILGGKSGRRYHDRIDELL